MTAAGTRPPAGSTVVVYEQDGGEYWAEVIESQQGYLILTEPVEADVASARTLGARLLLAWTSPDGQYRLPVVLAEIRGGARSVWVLDVTAEPWREQRRQHRRARPDLNSRVEIWSELHPNRQASDDREPTLGTLIDLSEVGLRCAVAEAPEDLTTAKVPVSVRLVLGQTPVRITGTLLQTRAGGPGVPRELVILFDASVEGADVIRDFVSSQSDIG